MHYHLGPHLPALLLRHHRRPLARARSRLGQLRDGQLSDIAPFLLIRCASQRGALTSRCAWDGRSLARHPVAESSGWGRGICLVTSFLPSRLASAACPLIRQTRGLSGHPGVSRIYGDSRKASATSSSSPPPFAPKHSDVTPTSEP